MNLFDTDVQELKYHVLCEVAKLSYASDLTPQNLMDIAAKIVPVHEGTRRIIFVLQPEDIVNQPVSRILDEFDFVGLIASDSARSSKYNYLADYKAYLEQTFLYVRKKRDGASRIASMLIEEATDINIYFGTTVNLAHTGTEIDFDAKLALIKQLHEFLEPMGKKVHLSLC